MIRYRFVFSKDERAKEKSFLKQIEYFKNFFISHFNLHGGRKSKFSFGPALCFGCESESEYVDTFFIKRMSDDEISIIINKNIDEGYSLNFFKTIPVYFPSVESVLDAVEYWIVFKDYQSVEIAEQKIINSVDKNMVFNMEKSNDSLIIILKKELTPKNLRELSLKDMDFKKIIRKKLYWQDSSGRLLII
jgi:uncharacterized protein (DUF2344 family)